LESVAKSDIEIAYELIRLLDGLPIERARAILTRAHSMALSTQILHADASLLLVAVENEKSLVD
jgi:hypothetical protein